MACRTAQARIAQSVRTALDVETMHAGGAIVGTGPARTVVGNMAVGAARMREHGVDLVPLRQSGGGVLSWKNETYQ